MTHELKIWPQYFCRVKDGTKTFEVRKNDRGFQFGDTVILREYDATLVDRDEHNGMIISTEPTGYTGQRLTFKIGYILPIADEVVVFSLLPIEEGTNNK